MTTFIPRVETLSNRVIRILGCNPGPFTLRGTNTYLIGTGKKRILLDAGDTGFPEYITNLNKVLTDTKSSIQEIIITHHHHDHLLGVPDVCRDVTKDYNIKLSKFARPGGTDQDLGNGIKYSFIQDENTFHTEGATLKALFTPGHADDHIVLYMEEEQAVFTGDTVLGEGTTTMDDLYDFMASLNKILEKKPKILYPAHGPVVNDPQKHIKAYIDHRNLRESQILQVLKEHSDQWMSAMELVKIIYKDVAENLHLAAAKNVTLHLGKLHRETKVDCDETGDTKWKLKALL